MANSFLSSSFPVLLPHFEDCTPKSKSCECHMSILRPPQNAKPALSTSSDLVADKSQASAFINALHSDDEHISSQRLMWTANGDGAFADSGEALVNLFHELEDVIDSNRLRQLLEMAWTSDSETTLKIIWNARSIHLGKSSKSTFYRAIGWLAQAHPRTLLHNLPWLVRPITHKTLPKEKQAVSALISEGHIDLDYVDVEGAVEESSKTDTRFDVKNGGSHGYWKDLLNILALAANDELEVDTHEKCLRVHRDEKGVKDSQKRNKRTCTLAAHSRILLKLDNDRLYRALHMTIAKLFADQLRVDIARLRSGEENEHRSISYAAKWAPSNKGMHDRQTFISSTIAELLHPLEHVVPRDAISEAAQDRALYLKYAREAYQSQTLAPLRKHLEVIERNLTAKTYDQIEYSHIPSLAMARYAKLFNAADTERFTKYLEDVAMGKANISGATLLPSSMVASALRQRQGSTQAKVLDMQWRTLVGRIRDSGSMQSAMAICDVSGSMFSPVWKDGTCPLNSAIGLSLIVAEVCKPPFGGHFITFSNDPVAVKIGGEDDTRGLTEKVKVMYRSGWGMSTDFEAVFTRLILPKAREYNVKPEEMVKHLFVFSDMHFNEAGGSQWSSSYKRIKKAFKRYGYEVPELIFWNLAGGRNAGVAPKPIEAHETGTALVSGYSQAMLKVFLDGGDFKAEPIEAEDTVLLGNDGEEVKSASMTPMAILNKAIGHDAYRMLKVIG